MGLKVVERFAAIEAAMQGFAGSRAKLADDFGSWGAAEGAGNQGSGADLNKCLRGMCRRRDAVFAQALTTRVGEPVRRPRRRELRTKLKLREPMLG